MAVATMQHPPAHEPAPEYPAIKPGMMGMYIFLASEVMFFGSLFGSHNTWPPTPPAGAKEFYVAVAPIPIINTVVLFSSAFTCHFAADALSHDNRRRFFILWTSTIILGLAFEFGQLYEFISAFSRGLDLQVNPFASAFFIMTGFHGAHVLGGLILLVLILYRAARGQFNSQHHVGVAAVTLYWHFVDVVWFFLFLILYVGVAYQP
jgi:cytochrome c oxidase subunit 3